MLSKFIDNMIRNEKVATCKQKNGGCDWQGTINDYLSTVINKIVQWVGGRCWCKLAPPPPLRPFFFFNFGLICLKELKLCQILIKHSFSSIE